jgi:deoxyadenosine/deoxycytidine kinase
MSELENYIQSYKLSIKNLKSISPDMLVYLECRIEAMENMFFTYLREMHK